LQKIYPVKPGKPMK